MSLCGPQLVKAPHCSEGLFSPLPQPLCFDNAGHDWQYLSAVFILHTETSNCIVSFNLGACLREISLSRQTGRKVILPSFHHEFVLTLPSFFNS